MCGTDRERLEAEYWEVVGFIRGLRVALYYLSDDPGRMTLERRRLLIEGLREKIRRAESDVSLQRIASEVRERGNRVS